MENLNKTIQMGNQISPRLLELLTEEPIIIPAKNYYDTIAGIFTVLNAASKLGWVEHTSDWDLGATIKTRHNQTIEITQGYADSLTLHDAKGKQMDINDLENFSLHETENFTLQLTEDNCDTDDEDVEPISILLSNIESIHIYS